jgi:hypothetical protein
MMATLIPAALTDLNRLEDSLAISSTFPAADKDILKRLINSSSAYISRICKRTFKYSTVSNELHDGRGVEWLTTDKFPIISITSIYDDPNRDYGSDTLIDSDDYEIYHADAGIVRYLEGTFSNSKSNVQISYVAGFSEFHVITGLNDQIAFNEGASNLTATISGGDYNASSLATEIKTQLDAAGADTYTVTYSEVMHNYTIASDGSSLSLLWSTSNNSRAQEFGKLIGFDISADDTGATSYVADYPALGVPEDLSDVCDALVRFRYEEIRERRIGKFSERRGEQSVSFDFSNLPVYIRELISPFMIRRL